MDWIPFDRWPECMALERPGYVFEVVNADGLTMLTSCVDPLPVPFDWKQPPALFRLVKEPAAEHAPPLPAANP